MNEGLRFAAGADFSKHTRWDNFKAAFNSLLAVLGLAESRSKVVNTKIDELDSASTHFATDVLKSSNELGGKMHRIALKDSSGIQSDKTITFVENENGVTEISTGTGRRVNKPMQFVDMQVLALKELLEIVEKSDPPKKINSNAIPNFDAISNKFHEKYGENGDLTLNRYCERDLSNSDNVLIDPMPVLQTEADIAAAQAKQEVINERNNLRQNEVIEVQAPPAFPFLAISENDKLTKIIIPQLDRLLNEVFSDSQEAGTGNVAAEKALDTWMTEIFGNASKYSSQAQHLVGNHLTETAKSQRTSPGVRAKQDYIDHYLRGAS